MSELIEMSTLSIEDAAGETHAFEIVDAKARSDLYANVIAGYERSGANLNKGSVAYGFIDESTGLEVTYVTTSAVCDPNYVPVEGGRSISWWTDANVAGANIYKYDANRNYIGKQYLAKYTGAQACFLDSNVAYVRWASWTKLDDIAGLKVAIYYSEDAKTEYEEYTESPYYEKAISSERVKNAYGLTITEQIAHITPEMFGAFGDGAHDDTTALNSCLTFSKENGTPIRGTNIYAVSEPLVIDFDRFDIELNGLYHSGSDYTVKFTDCSHGVAKIAEISAPSGNGVLISAVNALCEHNEFTFGTITCGDHCIKLYADGTGIQHDRIAFQKMKCANSCILLTCAETGWVTECHWTGGRLCGLSSASPVNYGIKAVGVIATGSGNHLLTTMKFHGIAFEGVVVGCYLENVHGFIFDYPRTSEAISSKAFELIGDVRACQFNLGWFYLSWLDYSRMVEPSSGNNFRGNFLTDGGAAYAFSSFTIHGNREMANVDQRVFGYRNMSEASSKILTLDPTAYEQFIPNELYIGPGVGTITLDTRYYNPENINTVYIITDNAITGDTVRDSDGNVIVDLAAYPRNKLRLTKLFQSISSDASEINVPNGWVIEVLA